MGGVIVSVFVSGAVDRGFKSRSGQIKYMYYNIGICCFPVKYAALKSKSKDGLARNHAGKCVRVERHVYLRTAVSVS
jgi:hypothetical protein